MCVITDENDIVVSISLIPGVNNIPVGYKVYFPVENIEGVYVGSIYKPTSAR